MLELLVLEGRHAEHAVVLAAARSSPIVASGGDSEIVSGSSLAKFCFPNAAAAAISRVTAWTETLTAGTAILSLSVKSRMVLILGLRVLSRKGCELSAEMPRTSCAVPRVFAHSVTRPGTPPATMSTPPAMRASFIAFGPLNVAQVTLTLSRPRAFACFSMRCWCSRMSNCT